MSTYLSPVFKRINLIRDFKLNMSKKDEIVQYYNVFAISLKGFTSLRSNNFIGPKKFIIVSLSDDSIMKYPL